MIAAYDLDPQRAQSLAIDGAVVVDPSGDEVLLREMPDRGIPVVTTSRPTSGAMRFPWVDNDQGGMAIRALDHFVRMGYRRPAVIATARRRSYVADIIDGYANWSRRHGAHRRRALRAAERGRCRSGAARRLLSRADPPDAFYATYDRLALGVLREMRRIGLAIPRDVGIPRAPSTARCSRWVEPSITAADIKPALLGSHAISMLVDLVEGTPIPASVLVPSRLVVRQSTRRRHEAGRA